MNKNLSKQIDNCLIKLEKTDARQKESNLRLDDVKSFQTELKAYNSSLVTKVVVSN